MSFLNIPERQKYSEKDLEQKIIDNLQEFLLELGKGFAFVGRQYRVTLNNKHYRIDLVFYHRILKCFVLIDLKINDIEHQDIGQMNMYLGYFETEMNVKNDNPPIGIILSALFMHTALRCSSITSSQPITRGCIWALLCGPTPKLARSLR